uniref:Zinc finger SWIM domain protein n=1 Tax=Caulobacter sp. (strain K31) TaxID=366602 RepID=B0SY81_CAUSK
MSRIHETLSDRRLERAAGSAAFARGAAYHAQGRVDLLSLGDDQAVARVTGSEIYRVRLRWRGGVAEGACDCPAFDSTDFCKHMVALAITARERTDDGPAIDRRVRLVEHLRRQGLEAAVARLVSLAEQHPEVWSEIEAEAQDAVEDDQTLVRRYRAEIESACDVPGPIGYYSVGSYAEGLFALLDRLERLNAGGRATAVSALMVHFLENMQEVFEAIDDSEGEVTSAVQRAVEIHLAACRETKPDPLDLAGWLFTQEMDSEWPAFEDLRIDYAEVLGEAGMAEYRRLAEAAWAAVATKDRAAQYTLRAILDHFACQDGDLDARIALRGADLSGPYAYLEIIQICMEAERLDLALKWAREAVWIFEDAPNARLVSLAAQLEEKAGRSDEAVSMLWRTFERSPDLALLGDLKRLSPTDVIDKAAEILEAKGYSAMLFELQLAEGRLDAAWKIADDHPIADWRLKALADASHQTHRLKAQAAYERLAESSVRLANVGAYDTAIKLIRLRGQVCDDPASQAAYIADLATRHKAKRTFIQRLEGLR